MPPKGNEQRTFMILIVSFLLFAVLFIGFLIYLLFGVNTKPVTPDSETTIETEF
jgi:hypothetical protein